MTNNGLLNKFKGSPKGVFKEKYRKAIDSKKLQDEERLARANGDAQAEMVKAKDRLHDKVR